MNTDNSNICRGLVRGSIVISVLYILTRCNLLGRELGYEESIFTMPGLNLFSGTGFFWSWGELVPHANPFHKPPLLSLLVAAFAQLTPEPGIGAKLVPFLCGWLIALIPLWLTARIAPSLLLLFSPFFFAAAGHVQTDRLSALSATHSPAGVCTSGIHHPKHRVAQGGLLLSGLAILWLGEVKRP